MQAAHTEPPACGDNNPAQTSHWRRLPIMWVLVGVVGFIVMPTVWSAVSSMGPSQWIAALALGLVFAPLAISVFLTFRVLDFPDLTVDASFPAGGAMAAALTVAGIQPWLTLPAAMALGALLGATTGLLHIFLRINSLLASIITLTAAFTINIRIQGSSNVSLIGVDRIFTPLTGPVKDQLESWFGDTGIQIHRASVTSIVTLVVVVGVVLMLRWFFKTEVGLALRATGANVAMSRSQGINTSGYLVGGIALSNSLAALTGALFVHHEGFADVNSGRGLIVAGLASVIIGEVLFLRHQSSILGHIIAVALGMIVYRIAIALALNATLTFPGVGEARLEGTDIKLATAAIVAIMLAFPRLRAAQADRQRRRNR